MVAHSLAYFEAPYIGGPPDVALQKTTEDFIAERAEAVLELVRANPNAIELPYGYKTHTSVGKVTFKAEWAEVNLLADGMGKLGFAKHRKAIKNAFSDWSNLASEFARKTEVSKADANAWGWANTLCELALFITHVMNIYKSEKSLLSNLYATNIREDALGRKNYQPAIEAISKVVKRNLGWKGECGAAPEHRATMLIALIERDRRATAIHSLRNGIEYERACERALRAEGYTVETTPASGDFGADLIAEKDGLRYAIQCKDLNKPVGVKGIQEAVSAKRHYHADFACVACDAGFTDAAIELATSNKVVVSNLKSLSAQLELAR